MQLPILALKKRIVRALVDEAMANIDDAASEIGFNFHSELRIPCFILDRRIWTLRNSSRPPGSDCFQLTNRNRGTGKARPYPDFRA
jgi:hypothetical protein